MPDFLVIGCLGIDNIIDANGHHHPKQPGGDAYYGAVSARIWGANVGVVSVVPKTYPQVWIDRLSLAGIDTSGVVRQNTSFGLNGTITYLPDGTRVLGGNSGALKFIQDHFPALLATIAQPIWRKVSPGVQHIPPAYLSAKGSFLASMAYRNQAECLLALHNKVKTIILDPPPLMPGMPQGKVPANLADLSKVDYLLPSQQEANEYFGNNITPENAVKRFFDLGARNVIFKKGEQGSLLFLDESIQPVKVPIYHTKVTDVTGAGDSFGAGFMVGMVETGDPVTAACYGAVSASFVIEGYGADYALNITREQAQERLECLLAQTRS